METPKPSPFFRYLIARGAPEDMNLSTTTLTHAIASSYCGSQAVSVMRVAWALGLRPATPTFLSKSTCDFCGSSCDVLCSRAFRTSERLGRPPSAAKGAEGTPSGAKVSVPHSDDDPFEWPEDCLRWRSLMFATTDDTTLDFWFPRLDTTKALPVLRRVGFEWILSNPRSVRAATFLRPEFLADVRFLDLRRSEAALLDHHGITLRGRYGVIPSGSAALSTITPISLPTLTDLTISSDNAFPLDTPALTALRIDTGGEIGPVLARLLAPESPIEITTLVVTDRDCHNTLFFERVLMRALLRWRGSVRKLRVIINKPFVDNGEKAAVPESLPLDAMAAHLLGIEAWREAANNTPSHNCPLVDIDLHMEGAYLPHWLVPLLNSWGALPNLRRVSWETTDNPFDIPARSPSHPLVLLARNAATVRQLEGFELMTTDEIAFFLSLVPRMRAVETISPSPHIPGGFLAFVQSLIRVATPSRCPNLNFHDPSQYLWRASEASEAERVALFKELIQDPRCDPWLACIPNRDTPFIDFFRMNNIDEVELMGRYTDPHRLRTIETTQRNDTDARAWAIVEKQVMRARYLPHHFHAIRERLRGYVGRRIDEGLQESIVPAELLWNL